MRPCMLRIDWAALVGKARGASGLLDTSKQVNSG